MNYQTILEELNQGQTLFTINGHLFTINKTYKPTKGKFKGKITPSLLHNLRPANVHETNEKTAYWIAVRAGVDVSETLFDELFPQGLTQ